MWQLEDLFTAFCAGGTLEIADPGAHKAPWAWRVHLQLRVHVGGVTGLLAGFTGFRAFTWVVCKVVGWHCCVACTSALFGGADLTPLNWNCPVMSCTTDVRKLPNKLRKRRHAGFRAWKVSTITRLR